MKYGTTYQAYTPSFPQYGQGYNQAYLQSSGGLTVKAAPAGAHLRSPLMQSYPRLR